MKFQASGRIVFLTIAIAILGVAVGRVHEPTQPEIEEKIIINEDQNVNRTAAIVGGVEASPYEFPYFVDLTICAGTLIAPRVVLTAAHCNPGNFVGTSVTVGAYKRDDKNNRNKRYGVLDGVAHPNFNKKKHLNNDFGLLLLDRPYYIDSSIRLVVNNDNKINNDGDPLTAIGMGTTSFQGSISDTLRKVTVPYVPRKECLKSYTGRLTKKMICAGEINGNKDACQGDSGSALIRRRSNTHYLVGVTSWGRDCGKFPGVYAKVSRVNNWIRRQVCDVWDAGTPELCTKPVKSAAICADDTSFAYEGDSEKTCAWVGENPEQRCKLKHGERRVKKYCKYACGQCED